MIKIILIVTCLLNTQVCDSTKLTNKMDPHFTVETYTQSQTNDCGKRESHKEISSGGTDPSSGYNYALIGCDFSLMLTSLHGRPASASITRNQLSSHPAVVSCLSPALFARSFVKIYCESNKCRPLNCRNRSASSALIRRPEFVMGSSSQGSSRWPTGFPELGANDSFTPGEISIWFVFSIYRELRGYFQRIRL